MFRRTRSGAETSCPVTDSWGGTTNFFWPGGPQCQTTLLHVQPGDGGFWESHRLDHHPGRDFAREMLTDSAAIILNQAAVQKTGMKNPMGMTVKYGGLSYSIIGVVADIVQNDPFKKVMPAFYCMPVPSPRIEGGHHPRPSHHADYGVSPYFTVRPPIGFFMPVSDAASFRMDSRRRNRLAAPLRTRPRLLRPADGFPKPPSPGWT